MRRESTLHRVIPVLLLAGLALGRWWKIAIPVAVLGWPTALIATGVGSGFWFAVGAGLLAAANLIVGVLAYQALRLLARHIASSAGHVS